jgi:SNF2 family DNA or RNA helicase
LLVCPKPLIPNWQREFKAWAEELPVVTLEGDAARRQMLWTMPGVTILLANYELLVRDAETFGEQPPQFDLVILDEAQRIKNRDSRTATTARDIPRKRSWALTGTPIENRPEELASLYEFMEVVPPRATPDLRQLTVLAKQFILRRTKNLVMKDLPPRLDRDEYLELAPAQRLAYDTAEKDGIVQLDSMGESISIQHVFELVLRLKQITNFDPLTGESTKLERVEADLEEIVESGRKAIIFSQWVGTLKKLADRPLLLLSYGAGGVGLNLQVANYAFLFDRWWNPAVEDQAINRVHRIGVSGPVTVVRFLTLDTIEERIDRVLQQKRDLFDAVFSDVTGPRRLGLTEEELFGLFDLRSPGGSSGLAA